MNARPNPMPHPDAREALHLFSPSQSRAGDVRTLMDMLCRALAAVALAVGLPPLADAQDITLRPAPAKQLSRYANLIQKETDLDALPPCPLEGKVGLCLHAYSSRKGDVAIVEVCKWLPDTRVKDAPDAREGIYLVTTSERLVRFPWFDAQFNRWSCTERDAEYKYRVRTSTGGAISRIRLEYRVNQEEGFYELAPRDGVLRVLKHKSADLT